LYAHMNNKRKMKKKKETYGVKDSYIAGHWWLMPVNLAIWETEIGLRPASANILKTPKQNNQSKMNQSVLKW
jgi:hypothetical protein